MGNKLKSFFAALGYLLMAFIIQVLVSVIGGMLIGLQYVYKQSHNMEQQGMTNVVNEVAGKLNYILLISSIVTVLIFLIIYAIRKKKLTEEILLKKTKPMNMVIAVLIGTSVWLFNSGILVLLQLNGLLMEQFQGMNEILNPLTEGNLFIMVLTIGIVAPFAEEFLFRGVIYRTLSKNISIPVTIIIQGVLFGIYHGNLIQGVYASLLGIIFGFITYKTQSLWPAIIAHMTNNTIAVIIPAVMGDIFNTTSCMIFVIIGLIGTIITIFFINKNNSKVIEENVEINQFII
ncbi:CAAX protease self-immunity family protein [Clostridium argentinense CDC 2741]|uniref:CAAX protease self-immunity family protein n=1 Tax=Clostridium argentinense CDC 2741 TaxID=1418104 RepID=A0A0C1UAV0_9CLOT|nr:CPBP family intramembrane glutamic endopeptidase [Clostridium argentinense]ARC86335.1 CPBP family intramembrane metalloprotease [Clostridium argentinense]KIE44710.1 CAAX protease self-immunity family protein [Clostridium argentinense CDC 2741]NFF40600.1 CPBP family intramembrane metalloprotease [Clostridium argentinense]NFP51161.1 CPBP family intramembrane metalloprotease [Clostridium argentinense]NFP73241.1 CPBP family intramembrane metalloprotease [Clostridium argentinense]